MDQWVNGITPKPNNFNSTTGILIEENESQFSHTCSGHHPHVMTFLCSQLMINKYIKYLRWANLVCYIVNHIGIFEKESLISDGKVKTIKNSIC